MCGRIQLSWDIDHAAIQRMSELLHQRFPNESVAGGEVFPSSILPLIIAGADRPDVALMRWGFPMHGSGKLIINARSETAAAKPMFAESLHERRCVLLTTGFYEWSHNGQNSKYLFLLPDTPVLYLAGLFRPYEEEQRFVILTTNANDDMHEIHDRMPVIIGQSEIRPWLNDNAQAAKMLNRQGPHLTKTLQ